METPAGMPGFLIYRYRGLQTRSAASTKKNEAATGAHGPKPVSAKFRRCWPFSTADSDRENCSLRQAF